MMIHPLFSFSSSMLSKCGQRSKGWPELWSLLLIKKIVKSTELLKEVFVNNCFLSEEPLNMFEFDFLIYIYSAIRSVSWFSRKVTCCLAWWPDGGGGELTPACGRSHLKRIYQTEHLPKIFVCPNWWCSWLSLSYNQGCCQTCYIVHHTGQAL